MTHRPTKRSWSSLLLALSNFGNFFFPLLRGVALARLLSKQDFGVAISITVVASIVNLISDIGLNQFAVKVADENTLPTLHCLALIRGILLGIVIALSGPLFAHLFQAPGTAAMYSVIGLVVAFQGFMHLGIKAAMRSYNFMPEAATDLTGHVAWTVTSIGAAWLLRDYRAMVFGLLAYSVAVVVVSHALAGSRWSLGWNREIVAQSLRFGRPLVPNGFAIATVNMGDRTLIGSVLGPDALASYSVLTTSAFTPRAAIVGFLSALVTPQFVNASTRDQGDRLLLVWTMIMSAIAAAFAFGYMAFGQPLITLVFGRRYEADQDIVTLIAVLSAIRYLASLVNPPSIAKGRTSLVLLNTATATSGLVLGVALAIVHPSIHVLVLGMCVGEILGFSVVIKRLLSGHPAIATVILRYVATTLLLVIGCALALHERGDASLTFRMEVCACFAVIAGALLARELASGRSSIRDVAKVFLPAHG